MAEGTCPNCGETYKNIGSHQRWCVPPGGIIPVDSPDEEPPKPIIVVDKITEKPLSSIIADIEAVLKTLQHQLNITIIKENGNATTVEIKARFQTRR